ncbi:MAG: hypothetical protein ACXU8A_03885 [Burkholderiaceae bacterium]
MLNRTAITTARAINSSLIALVMLASAAQFFIDLSTDNIASVSAVLCSSMITLLYLRGTNALTTHPLSTFAIFGFCITSQMGALLVQSVFWTSLSHDLRQPVTTFWTLGLYQVIAISAHVIYRFFIAFPSTEKSSVSKVLTKLGLYATPTVENLWVIGVIGLFALLTSGGGGKGDVGGKVSAGISFLAWCPFLIPIYAQRQGPCYCKEKIHYLFLFAYILLIALLGIASNARGMMFSGIVTMGLIALLAGMRSNQTVSSKQIAKVVTLLAVGMALIVPFSDLATAMVIARSGRATASASKMIDQTFYVLQQPHLIEAQRLRDKLASLTSSYDENYIANPIMARFVETKFHDNSLYFASKLSPRAEDELLDTTVDLLWAMLPDPVLKQLGIPIKKERLRFSMGDYLSHQSIGGPLGGYKTGSALAHGIGLFGMFFPFVYLATCLILFPLLDILAFRSSSSQTLLSVVGMLTIWRLFLYGITAESLTNIFSFVARGFIQMILLYLVVYQFSRLITKFLPDFSASQRLKGVKLNP